MRSAETRPASPAAAWPPWERREDRRTLVWALAAAIAAHVALLSIGLPDAPVPPVPEKPDRPPITSTPIPLPPRPQRESAHPDAHPERRTPVPFETSPSLEPVPERDLVVEVEAPEIEIDVVGYEPDPPPQAPGVLRPGRDGVTSPTLILDSKVAPEYPPLARRARVEGRVIVEAVILADGSVADVQVLQCSRPDFGFEAAAIEAIRQWRYEPATQAGRPVDVYFTVVVTFELR